MEVCFSGRRPSWIVFTRRRAGGFYWQEAERVTSFNCRRWQTKKTHVRLTAFMLMEAAYQSLHFIPDHISPSLSSIRSSVKWWPTDFACQLLFRFVFHMKRFEFCEQHSTKTTRPKPAHTCMIKNNPDNNKRSLTSVSAWMNPNTRGNTFFLTSN